MSEHKLWCASLVERPNYPFKTDCDCGVIEQPPATPPRFERDAQTIVRLEQERDHERKQREQALLLLHNAEAQVANLLPALRETLDVVFNQTAGQSKTPWVLSVIDKAQTAIANAEKGGAQ
jgi:hypothetical protein